MKIYSPPPHNKVILILILSSKMWWFSMWKSFLLREWAPQTPNAY